MQPRSLRSAVVTAALFFVASLVFPPFLMYSPLSSTDAQKTPLLGVLLALAAEKLQPCAELTDLLNYGINQNLLNTGGPYYLGSQYFCADTAPAQYHCTCSLSTTCKRQADPWGRNIGVCGCCPGWMITCFVLLAFFFALCIGGSLYAMVCHGRWWCDGYTMPSPTLLPRRGLAVTCPPSRPLPDNLFRGYASHDFINVQPAPAEDSPVHEQIVQRAGRAAATTAAGGGHGELEAFASGDPSEEMELHTEQASLRDFLEP